MGQVVLVNQAPTYTAGPNISVLENSGAFAFPNWATNINPGQPAQAFETVTFHVTTDKPYLFTVQPAIDTTGKLTFTLASNQIGTAFVTVVADNGGSTAYGGVTESPPLTFTVTIQFVNQPPSFTAGPNETVTVYSGTSTFPGWATNISSGPQPVQSFETVSFLVTSSNPAAFTTLAVTGNGTLVINPSGKYSGTFAVTVQAKNNGGTANGGQDTSSGQTFFVTINPLFTKTSDANAAWIAQVYRDLLTREIDPASLTYWTNLLDNGLDRFTAVLEIENSTEFRKNYINSVFMQALGAPADPAGINYFLNLLGQGDTLLDVRARILASDAFYFKQNKPSAFSFLNGVYQVVFGHGIDTGGANIWGTLLAQDHGDRYPVVLAILNTPDALTVEINNYFTAYLGRNADANGDIFYVSELQAGTREESVIASIFASVEYANKIISVYDPTKDTTWLNQVFMDLLQHGIDANGANYFTTELREGKDRAAVVTEIATSNEYRLLVVDNLFVSILHRNANPGENTQYVQMLQQGKSMEFVESVIYGSAEYFQHRGNNNNLDFLKALFQDILQAPLDSASQQYWGSQLGAGVSNQQVAFDLLTSTSGYQVLVNRDYTLYLHRPVDAGLAVWVNDLMNGATDEQILGAIIGSTEYYNRATS